MLIKLNEDSRSQLLSKARKGAEYKGDKSKGKNRYERRTKSKISNSVREYNRLNMNKFFQEDILELNILVHGETDDYLVGVSFSGILELIRDETDKDENSQVDLALILKMLKRAFNKEDHVKVKCNCKDWTYRMSYWASVNDIILGDKENRPSDETNPNDNLGPACKHVILVLSNTSWLIKLASAINNYIHYVQDHYEKSYADIIYPALYNRPIQGELFGDQPIDNTMDADDAKLSQSDVTKANVYGSTRTQFKKGNRTSSQFQKSTPEPSDEDDQQMSLDLT